jgi:hypothetical protein
MLRDHAILNAGLLRVLAAAGHTAPPWTAGARSSWRRFWPRSDWAETLWPKGWRARAAPFGMERPPLSAWERRPGSLPLTETFR